MKAVVFHEHGGPEKLVYEDRPDPRCGPDDALVQVKAASVNHLDIWLRQGIPSYSIPLPHISGCDVAGIVERVGDRVTHVRPGDRIIVSPGLGCRVCDACVAGRDNLCPNYHLLGGAIDGGYAENVAVAAAHVLPMPKTLSFEQAAAFPLVFVTAYHMLIQRARLRTGEAVLIWGAGGGVGTAAVQIAKLSGATVIATAGTDTKLASLTALGADDVINHSREDVVERVLAATNRQGADVVFDHIGKETWDKSLRAIGKGGRFVLCGTTTGGDVGVDIRRLFMRQVSVIGSYMGTRGDLSEICRLMDRGLLKPVIDSVRPLKEAAAAQKAMLDRTIFGKLILVP